jgi:hypothetical protein
VRTHELVEKDMIRKLVLFSGDKLLNIEILIIFFIIRVTS